MVGGWVGEQPSLSAGEGGKGAVGVWVKQSLHSALSNEGKLRHIAPVLCSLFHPLLLNLLCKLCLKCILHIIGLKMISLQYIST